MPTPEPERTSLTDAEPMDSTLQPYNADAEEDEGTVGGEEEDAASVNGDSPSEKEEGELSSADEEEEDGEMLDGEEDAEDCEEPPSAKCTSFDLSKLQA